MESWCSTTLRRRLPARVVWTPGLNRFAEAQALSGAADALVAVSLAGSLFFSLSPDASARAGPALPAHQHGAVRPAGAADRAGHRPLPARPPLDRRRSCSRCAPLCAAALAFTLLDLALYFFALALLIAAKASGVVAPGARPGARRRARPARRRQLPPGPPQRHRRRRRRRRSARPCSPSPGRRPSTLGLACAAFVAAGHRHAAHAPDHPRRRARTPASSTRSCTRRRSSPRRGRSPSSAPPSASSCSAWPSPCAATSEPAWMYGAAVAAYGVGTFAGNAVAPAAAAPLRRGPPHRRRARRPRHRRRVRRPRAVPAARAARRRVVLGGAAVGRPPGLRRARPDARPGGVARPVVRPLRDPLPARLGRRRHRRRRPSAIPIRSAWRSSPSA